MDKLLEVLQKLTLPADFESEIRSLASQCERLQNENAAPRTENENYKMYFQKLRSGNTSSERTTREMRDLNRMPGEDEKILQCIQIEGKTIGSATIAKTLGIPEAIVENCLNRLKKLGFMKSAGRL